MKLNDKYHRTEGDVFNVTIYHYLKWTISCNEFKVRSFRWSGVHFNVIGKFWSRWFKYHNSSKNHEKSFPKSYTQILSF